MSALHTMNTQPAALFGSRYRLLHPLGSGGMGVVYRAYDHLQQEEVALKQINVSQWQTDAPELRLALAREFQALSALRHPGIITVRDYGFDENRLPFFTMELLPLARSLLAAGEMLTHNGRIDLILQLLTTLIYVHRAGVIHRDLKPGNVLVTTTGDVKMLDFGLAVFAGQAAATSGTMAYMAPELLQGQPASPASDLYAVGVMAYELLAGWHPFAHAATLPLAILHSEPDFSLLDISPPLQAVIQQLLAKEPAARYSHAAAALAAICTAENRPLPPETSAARESFLQAAPFTGRTAELAQLNEARQQAAAGQGSAWLLQGESGIGKSRLLQELRTLALVDGMAVLRGQARPNGGAYHLWAEVIRSLRLHVAADDLETAVLHAIIPGLTNPAGNPVPPAPSLPPAAARTRLHLTVIDWLRRSAAGRPLLLLLEDLHWADDASLALLPPLLAQLSSLPLCVVASNRPGERPGLPAQLAAMHTLPLTPLGTAHIASLSAAMLGENGRHPALLTFLHRETEGNTFFIVEVVRALAEEAGRLDQVTAVSLPASIFPSGVQQVMQRRLARVPARSKTLLQKTAVFGRQIDNRLLAHLSPQTNLQQWLTACANAGILEQPIGTASWQFSHDKLREALLRQIPARRLRRCHADIADGIETVYAADLSPHYHTLAYHFGHARHPEKQRHYLWLAARHAEATYANAEAIDAYTQLLPLLVGQPAHIDALLALAAVAKISGQWDDAAAHLHTALAAPAITTDQLARAHKLLGNLARGRNDYDLALASLTQARRAYAEIQHLVGLSQVMVETANIYYQQGKYEEAYQQLAAARSAAEAAGDETCLAMVDHNLGSLAYAQGDYETAAARYTDALQLRLHLPDKLELANSYNNLGLVAFRRGAWQTAQKHLQESLAIRRQSGDRWGTAASLSNLGLIPYQQRDYDTARHYWEEALHTRRRLGDAAGVAGLLDNLALIAVAQQQMTTAQTLIAEAVTIREQLDDRQGLSTTLGNRGRLALLMGQPAAAAADYRASLRLAHELGDQLGMVFSITGVAAVWATSGRSAAAARLLAAATSHLAHIGGSWESDEKALYDQAHQQVQADLAPAAYAAAWENGRSLSLTEVIATIMEDQHDTPAG